MAEIIGTMGCAGKQRIAIIAHVFYLDIWPEISRAIHNIANVDEAVVVIYATFPKGHHEIANAIRNEFCDAHVLEVSNVGWDVWPFFAVLNDLNLSDWDLVVKLHTKRNVSDVWINFRPFATSDGWRKALLSFCASPHAAKRSVRAFAVQPKIGMIASDRVIDPNGLGTGRSIGCCAKILDTMGLSSQSGVVVWGTMWMIRASLLAPLWRRWHECDFVAPHAHNPHAGYGLAGDCEVLFGVIVSAQGYFVSSGVMPRGISIAYFLLKSFIYKVLRSTFNMVRALLSRT